jgi:hypothetical protein
MEGKNFYSRFGGIKHALIFERTGHLALQTTGAFSWIDMERFKHLSASFLILGVCSVRDHDHDICRDHAICVYVTRSPDNFKQYRGCIFG